MTDTAQLDTDVKRYVELDALRADLTLEMEAIKERLRDGGTQTAPCGIKVTVSPNRRFDANRAASTLPAELLTLCQSVVVDSAKAKSNLPPAIYEGLMSEVGAPRVSIK